MEQQPIDQELEQGEPTVSVEFTQKEIQDLAIMANMESRNAAPEYKARLMHILDKLNAARQ